MGRNGDAMEIFYFNSPRRPCQSRSRSLFNNKAKVAKRYRPTRMDGSTQHACVARFDEPLFYPTSTTSIIPYYGLPSVVVVGDDTSSTATSSQVTEISETRPDTEPDLTTGPHAAASQTPLAPQLSRTTDVHRARRARSLSPLQDLRRRGVLADILNESVRQYGSPDGIQHCPEPRIIATTEMPQIREDTVNADNPILRARSRTNPFSRPIATTPFPYDTNSMHANSRSSLASTSLRRISNVYEEYLAVDDPKRCYDFADFMSRWRRRYHSPWRRPPFELGTQPSFSVRGLPDDVTGETMQRERTDIQGLRWDLIGAERNDIVRSRAVMNPSRNGWKTEPHPPAQRSVTLHPYDPSYRFNVFLPRHRARYMHFQLRNLLAASSRNDIFYSTGNQVVQASLSCTTAATPIMDLSKNAFRITCLAMSPQPICAGSQSNQVLFAGGFNGEYAMLNLNSKAGTPPSEGFITHAYNGLVTHVDSYHDRHSGMVKAAFCSNDMKIRLLDIETETFVSTFTYERAINCSAISPDGRLRVLAGDSPEIVVTDAEHGNVQFKLSSHEDDAFACAWSPDGRYLASGSQDGKVFVWDARDLSEPLESLSCTMASARSLHFTDDGRLIVAEDEDVVSVYDTRTFSSPQDICFFGSIAGVVVLDGGAEVVVANADNTVGGLMAFRRVSQGFNAGTYGERINRNLALRFATNAVNEWPDCLNDIFV